MAKPIEPTPTLSGKDALSILSEIENPIYNEKKEAFLKECKDNFNKTQK